MKRKISNQEVDALRQIADAQKTLDKRHKKYRDYVEDICKSLAVAYCKFDKAGAIAEEYNMNVEAGQLNILEDMVDRIIELLESISKEPD